MSIPPNALLHGRYRIVRLIAEGGMGAVYQATDQHNGATVAVKQSSAATPELGKAFEREARMLRRLRHPSLPVVSDYFTDSNGQYLVMEYIPGTDLGTLLERKGKNFSNANMIPWVMHWADQLLDVLSYLHGQKSSILHRDIKPRNLKVTPQGDIMLLDFGMAKSAIDQTRYTPPKSVRGYTTQYAPLEQIQGTGTDTRSDIYSLAATLYHLLTSVEPPDALTRVAAVLNGDPDPLRSAHELNPLVSPVVAVILHQALDQNKSGRFASANAMRRALLLASPSGKTASSSSHRHISSTTPGYSTPAYSTGHSQQNDHHANHSPAAPSNPAPLDSGGQQTILASSMTSMPPDAPPPYHSGGQQTILTSPPSEPPGQVPNTVDSSGQQTLFTSSEATESSPRRITKRINDRVAEMQAAQVQDTSHCIIVAPHGDNVCRTIGEAVRLAHPGARILVQPGIYHEGIVLDKPLEILGDGLAEDIIIESSGVSCIHMQTDYALVRGLTLRGRVGPNEQLAVAVDIPRGRLVLEDCDIASDTLACVYVHTSLARPVLWRCSIHDSADAGIVFSQQSRGTVEQCDIADNEKSGIRILQGASPIIHDCTIHHGKYNGIYVGDRGAGTIESCDIFDNERTGIEISEESTPFIRNCRIHDQVTGYGIYVYERGSGIIEGCDISGNAQAGVRISESGNPFIRHCKIHDEKQVGIAMVENSQGILEGCDFFNNARTGVCIGESGTSGKREHPRNGDEYDETLVWDSEIENIEEWSIFRNAHAA